MIDIYNWAKENDVIKGSAVLDLKEIDTFLKSLNINIAIEIGTAYGISAAFIAQYAKEVHTFDVQTYPCRNLIWEKLNVNKKIHYHLIKDRAELITIIKDVPFDFAFIDACHKTKEIIKDFRAVKHCGRVLFHDVDEKRYSKNYILLKNLGGKIIANNLGYWEGK